VRPLPTVVRRASCSSRIHQPDPLRSPGVTRLHRYYEVSDSCPAALRIHMRDDEHRLVPGRSLCVMYRTVRPFRLQPPPVVRDARVCVSHPAGTAGVGRSRPHRERRDHSGTSASPATSRLATTTGRIEFTFVTDWPFAFRCSPPRLAATQFRSATGSNSNLLTRTRTSLIQYTCKRTSPQTSVLLAGLGLRSGAQPRTAGVVVPCRGASFPAAVC
jgi:hypothetical protein